MWLVNESRSARKALEVAPANIRAKWDIWLRIVKQSGPQGLRAVKGFHDEALSG